MFDFCSLIDCSKATAAAAASAVTAALVVGSWDSGFRIQDSVVSSQ